MLKKEKLDIIQQAIDNTQACGCVCLYDTNGWTYYYPNMVNEKFMLGQQFDDFLLDGYIVRKISQLNKVKYPDGVFEEINKMMGITAKVQTPNVDISTWASIFKDLKALNRIVIIEHERWGDFEIGLIQKVSKNKVTLLGFDINGVWDEGTWEIPYSAITSLKWDTRYTIAWERYFASKNKAKEDN